MSARWSRRRIALAIAIAIVASVMAYMTVTGAITAAGVKAWLDDMGPWAPPLFEIKGGASGGTVASMLGLVDAAARDREVRRLLLDPYALDPAGAPRGGDRDARGPGYDRALGVFTAPFVMAAVNTRVVRRSHALLDYPWGDVWHYDERMGLPRSARGAAMAVGVTGALAGFVAATQLAPLRRALEARLPKPGEGPSAEVRQRGRYRVRLHGTVDGVTRVATFADDLDPGYAGTAKLLGEAALALALDPPASGGGVLTPAVALARRATTATWRPATAARRSAPSRTAATRATAAPRAAVARPAAAPVAR